MKISELRKAIAAYETLLEQVGGGTEHREALKQLNAWLARFNGIEASELNQLSLSDGAPPAPRPSKQADSSLVTEYSDMFKAAAGDRARFELAFSQLRSDKRVRLAELNEIALRYVGGTSKYKSKADAMKEIKLRFDAGLNAAARANEAAKM